MLGRGSARVTFAVGVLLTFPGVSYLTALDRIAKLDCRRRRRVLLVLAFCLIQQLLLEVPLLGYAVAPERTQRAVTGFRDWLARNGRARGDDRRRRGRRPADAARRDRAARLGG